MRRSIPTVPRLTRLLALGGICLTLTSCDTTPSSPAVEAVGPLSLRLIAGDGQSALPGEELPNPLVVSVTDSRGHRVRGKVVNFRVVEGGGTTFAGVAITNSDGIARERWSLGMRGPQRLEARAIDENSGDAVTFGVFTATVIDAQAPVATDSVRPNPALTTDPVRLNVTINDELTGGSRIAGASYSLDGGAFVDMQPLDGQLDSSIEVFEVVLPAFGAAGQHRLCARGRDAADNVSEDACETLVIVAPPPPAQLSIVPASWDFGSVGVGATVTRAFDVRNTGGQSSGLVSVTLSASSAGFSIQSNGCGAPLPPAGACIVSVRFGPTQIGQLAGALNASAAPGGPAQATLTGAGVAVTSPQTSLLAQPPSLQFPAIALGSSSIQPVTIVNTGAFPAQALAFAMSLPAQQDFTLGSGGSCIAGMTLNPGQNCSLLVTFAPQLAGQRLASVSVSAANAPTLSIALTGTGTTPPPLSITPTSYNFGNVTVGGSANVTFTVRNNASEATEPLSVGITGTNAADFSISSSATTCGPALAPATTCAVTVTFSPSVAGPRTALVSVLAGTSGSASAQLSGAGGSAGSLVFVSPPVVNFGNVVVGQQSAPQTIRVQNASSQPLSQVSVQVVGSSEFPILQDGCRAGMPPGGVCDVVVAFRPAAIGARGAQLAFITGVFATLTGTLQGSGIAP